MNQADDFARSPFPYLRLVERLKAIPRAGWVLRDVPNPESVASHSFGLAQLALLLPTNIDLEARKKAVQLALVHDVAESLIGDITPSDGISREEKRKRERFSNEYLAIELSQYDLALADEYRQLTTEYMEAKTEAATLVHDLDVIERSHQAWIYASREEKDSHKFEVFREELKKKIQHPTLQPWASTLLQAWENDSRSKKAEILILFVVGGPGVGKGTQCERATRELGFDSISAGEILREEMSSPSSPYKKFIEDSMRESVIIPAQLLLNLLDKKLKPLLEIGKSTFLLDGFPRSMEQLHAFEAKFSKQTYTIFIESSVKTLERRLAERAKSSGRIDDNPESIRKRIDTFNEKNQAVLDHLKKGIFIQIDGGGSVDETWREFEHAVHQIRSQQS